MIARAMPAIHDNVIVIDDTASEADDAVSIKSENTDKKRKAEPSETGSKVIWTDESDSVPSKPKKKRRVKRKSTKKIDAEALNDTESAGENEDAAADIPDYLRERRAEFDENRRKYHVGALMIPPDYEGIDLESHGVESVPEERPVFSEASGIRPWRPYQDIELPQSAGVIPAPIAQYLRDYQIDGVKFLHRKFVYQEGAILGDDMGLGKTVQVAAFLAVAFGKTGDERDQRRLRAIRNYPDRWYPRVLIVCPGSLIMNWKNELDRWGWWHVDIYHGPNKDDVLGTARAGRLEVMITTYETYKNGSSHVNMVPWDVIIADECHRLKDRHSETTKALNQINALCRIGLTGTAIQNKYEELWTLLDWTNPGQFGTKSEWTRSVSKPLAVGQSHEATNAQLSLARQTAKKLVQNLLPRFFLRRMKSLIADQLPKKTDRVVFCPLTDFQREAYETFLDSEDITTIRNISEGCEHGKKRGWCCGTHLPNGKPWQSVVFPSMFALQKLANHVNLMIPSTIEGDEKHKSELEMLKVCFPNDWRSMYQQRDRISSLVNPELCGKWKVLKKLLKFWHGNGDKVLVFSHSVRLLRILVHLFHNTSYSLSYLDGSLKYEERQAVVDTFNSDPSQFVFLISTKAGGVGLNITSANKVVIMDPHWNPSFDLQAQDRAYRIGQTRDVEVFRFISLGTVEEIVYARQVYKQQQANIGYTASSERRYFRGVQQDADRKGEIFGLSNIFTYHSHSSLLRDIVNKTNIAEAKAGVSLVDVDMDKAATDDDGLALVKKEEADGEDGGMRQLAALLTTEDQQKLIEKRKSAQPKTDAIQAILTSAGVEYTHDNAEVVGSSKVEEELSKRAELMSYEEGDVEGHSALFSTAESQSGTILFHPPEDVCLRQFCEMAREFGFMNAREFALIVEGWSQEARINCLEKFYKKRKRLAALAVANRAPFGLETPVYSIEGALVKNEGGHASLKTEAVKDEDIKGEDVKHEGIKDEDVKDGLMKRETLKIEPVKKEEVKQEDTKPKPDPTEDDDCKEEVKDIKPETKHLKYEPGTKQEYSSDTKHGEIARDHVKAELGGQRRSIFLIEDDDDEL